MPHKGCAHEARVQTVRGNQDTTTEKGRGSIVKAINARFLVYVNSGFVKLTLSPGQRLSWSQASPTEEGWHRDSEAWHFDGVGVFHMWCSEGRDCDGLLSHSGEDMCAIELLAARPAWDGIHMLPRWEEVSPTIVYDQYAQEAGY